MGALVPQSPPPAKPFVVLIDETQALIGGTSNSGKTLAADLVDAIQRLNATDTKEN